MIQYSIGALAGYSVAAAFLVYRTFFTEEGRKGREKELENYAGQYEKIDRTKLRRF
jgi:hypothetical protein